MKKITIGLIFTAILATSCVNYQEMNAGPISYMKNRYAKFQKKRAIKKHIVQKNKFQQARNKFKTVKAKKPFWKRFSPARAAKKARKWWQKRQEVKQQTKKAFDLHKQISKKQKIMNRINADLKAAKSPEEIARVEYAKKTLGPKLQNEQKTAQSELEKITGLKTSATTKEIKEKTKILKDKTKETNLNTKEKQGDQTRVEELRQDLTRRKQEENKRPKTGLIDGIKITAKQLKDAFLGRKKPDTSLKEKPVMVEKEIKTMTLEEFTGKKTPPTPPPSRKLEAPTPPPSRVEPESGKPKTAPKTFKEQLKEIATKKTTGAQDKVKEIEAKREAVEQKAREFTRQQAKAKQEEKTLTGIQNSEAAKRAREKFLPAKQEGDDY